MMSNEKLHNNQIGLRIRTARKEKGINQTELANLLENRFVQSKNMKAEKSKFPSLCSMKSQKF